FVGHTGYGTKTTAALGPLRRSGRCAGSRAAAAPTRARPAPARPVAEPSPRRAEAWLDLSAGRRGKPQRFVAELVSAAAAVHDSVEVVAAVVGVVEVDHGTHVLEFPRPFHE